MIDKNSQIELLSKAELSIWLDTYDDIFSDFDSRPFNERTLSDDFLSEARKMVREKPQGKIELKLLMPDALRNKETEATIIKNLHAHFRHIAHVISVEKKKVNQRGVIMTVIGFIVMALAAYVSYISNTQFYYSIIRVILEPAGWFMVWSGLDNIFYISRKTNPDLEFNSRMGHSEIIFLSF